MTRILCIDDEADFRDLLIEELHEAGFDTIAAGNGADGLRLMLQTKPDLVICDMLMPAMSGAGLLLEIHRKHPQLRDVPFIMVSGFAETRLRNDVLQAGVAGYLAKPIDFDVLFAKITACLSGSWVNTASSA